MLILKYMVAYIKITSSATHKMEVNNMDEIIKAIELLGFKGDVTTKRRDDWTLDVFIDGIWFGLWDNTKNTFVE